ncbi:hypothetical protein OROGR_019529 [Orobanche gracilis]
MENTFNIFSSTMFVMASTSAPLQTEEHSKSDSSIPKNQI